MMFNILHTSSPKWCYVPIVQLPDSRNKDKHLYITEYPFYLVGDVFFSFLLYFNPLMFCNHLIYKEHLQAH